jgi:hypothetical protein
MSVKPVLLSEIRKTAVQQHQQLVGRGEYNRFSPLEPRARAFSFGKRKLDNSDSGPHTVNKNPRFDPSVVLDQLKDQGIVFKEVKSNIEKAEKSLEKDPNISPQVLEAMKFFGSALTLLADSQEKITSTVIDGFNAKQGNAAQHQNAPQGKPAKTPVVLSQADIEAAAEAAATKKVKTAIRDAEKKSLIFNLDLGKVPTMNKETLSRKVTMALNSKVQAGEHDYDIKDAEEVLDDILSCSKIEFLGGSTKAFFNKRNVNDVRNNTFCTIPVRMDFKDRESRINAETNLRKICKVSCAVPYPKKLRDILDNLVTQGKKLSPGNFIRTRVNVDTLSIDVHAKTKEGWKDLHLKTCIPTDICDAVSTNNTVNKAASSSVDENMQVS